MKCLTIIRGLKMQLFGFIACCLALLLVLLSPFSSSASAAERNNIQLVWVPKVDFGGSDSTVVSWENGWGSGYVNIAGDRSYVQNINLYLGGSPSSPGVTHTIPSGRHFTFTLTLTALDGQSTPVCPSSFLPFVIDSCDMDFDYSPNYRNGQDLVGQGSVTYSIEGHLSSSYTGNVLRTGGIPLSSNASNIFYWGVSEITFYDVPSANLQQAVDFGNQQANENAQKQLDATENQTKQDKEQYEQEKQEEQDREDSANEEGGKLAGIFNISLLNPFAGIWEIFNAGGCTSIPTISSWTHAEDTTYCSWWPQSIRATLTPVFSLAAMMLLFGFVAKWLGGNEGINVRIN